MKPTVVPLVASLLLLHGCEQAMKGPAPTLPAATGQDTDPPSDTDADIPPTDTGITDTDTDPPLMEDCFSPGDDDGDGRANCADTDCIDQPPCSDWCPPQDAFEDNDTQATAWPATQGEDLVVHSPDPDWFDLGTVPPGEIVSVDLVFDPLQANLWSRLVDSAGVEVALPDALEDGQHLIWANTTNQAESISLQLRTAAPGPDGLCSGYTFDSHIGAPAAEICDTPTDDDGDGLYNCGDPDCQGSIECPECVAEESAEPNDTSTTAAPLETNPSLGIFPGNPDWWEQELAPGEALQVELQQLTGSVTARLEDQGGVVLESGGLYWGQDRSWSVHNDSALPRTYRVVVETTQFCGGYAMTSARWTVGDEVCDDGLDNDLDGLTDCEAYDCIGTAACIGICPIEDAIAGNHDAIDAFPATPVADLATFTDRSDWFVLQPSPGEMVHATVTTDPAYGEADLQLFDQALMPIGEKYLDGGIVIAWALAPATGDVVYLEVSTEGTCAAYDLDAFASGPQAANEDCTTAADNDLDGWPGCYDQECGGHPACDACGPEDVLGGSHNSLETAVFVDTLSDGWVHAQNADWFGIVVAPGEVADASMSSPGSVIAVWHDDAGVPMPTGDPLTNTTTSALNYYLQVRVDQSNNWCTTYDLAVTYRPIPQEDCGNGIDDDFDLGADCFDLDCFGAPACLTPTCPGEDTFGGDNDTEATAAPFADNTGLVVHALRDDWFTLDLPPDSYATIERITSADDGRIGMRVYDDEVLLDHITGYGDVDAVTFANPSGATATFLLVLELYQTPEPAHCNTYDLTMTSFGPAPDEWCFDGMDNDFDGWQDCHDLECSALCSCPPEDAFPGNHSPEDAVPDQWMLDGLATFSAAPDHWRYSVGPGQTVEATVSPDAGSVEASLEWEDADGSWQLASTDTSSVPFVLTWTNPGDDSIDVVMPVRPGGSEACSSYAITTALLP